MILKKNNLRRGLRLTLLAAVAAGAAWWAGSSRGDVLRYEPHYRRIAMVMADGLPQVHITHKPLDNAVSRLALDNFLSSLDHDRTLFLTEDVAQFKKLSDELDDFVRGGHLEFAYAVFEVLKERVADRVEYVNKLVDKGFDLTLDESYTWKRREAEWPADRVEWNELWRKKIKNEYLAHVINRTLKEEEAAGEEPGEGEEAASAEDAEQAEEDTAPEIDFSPEEKIRRAYKQFESVLNEHDAEWVLQVYLNAFAGAYDSHSAYMSPRGDEDFDIQMSLSLEGIGALLTLEDGAAKIVRLIAGGPAERDGRLHPGDKIVAVAQEGEEAVDILYWPLYKSVRLIRGPKGSAVTLSIIPASDPTESSVEKIRLVRDEIKLEDRAAQLDVREVEPGEEGEQALNLGVLKLPDFYADLRAKGVKEKDRRSSSRDVRELLERLEKEEVDGLLLDLRNNGGGSLTDAIEMTGYFIEEGPVVQVKSGRRVRIQDDPHDDILYDGPLVVLVNRMSASASEILAAALQDYGRAVIVGDGRTHGKGSVQSVFALDRFDKKLGSMKITTAGFYRVDGRSTQLHGVEPDLVIPSVLDVMEVGEEFLPNVLELPGIEEAPYEPFGELEPVIEELEKRSAERRNRSERFATYAELLERQRQRQAMDTLSLNLEKRLELARADRAFNEKLKAFRAELPEGEDEEDDRTEEEKQQADLILNEALYILRDLAELSSGAPSAITGQPEHAGGGA